MGGGWAKLMVLGKERSRQIWPVFRRWNPKGSAVEEAGRSRLSLGLGHGQQVPSGGRC